MRSNRSCRDARRPIRTRLDQKTMNRNVRSSGFHGFLLQSYLAHGIDIRHAHRSLVAMSRVRNKLVAACLLACWLVATQHCGLESAGLFAAHDGQVEANGCCASSEGCANDGCEMVEEGAYRPDPATLGIVSPQLSPCLWSVTWNSHVSVVELRTNVSDCGRHERPLDWLPTWQFVRRAALSPRAPSFV